MSVVTCITHFCSSPVRDFIYLPEPRGRITPLQLSFPFLLRLPFSPPTTPARYLRFGINLLHSTETIKFFLFLRKIMIIIY